MSAKLSYGPQFTMPALSVEADEIVHTFHIDWMGGDISFESTFYDVMYALQIVTQSIFDYENPVGAATVATFFRALHRFDIVEQYPQMREYGWCAEALSDCCVYWLPYVIEKRNHARNDYDIRMFIYPNDNLREIMADYGGEWPDEVFYEI